MPLVYVSLLTGIFFSGLGLLLVYGKGKVRASMLSFPRSKKCSLWFVGMAVGWFLCRHVANLSEADFGNYKLLIGSIALGVAILSFKFVPDFLAVRGLAMMILLLAREVLDSAFLHDAGTRLVLVAMIYLLVVFSIYFGAWPYKMKEFLVWLNEKNSRMNLFGWTFGLWGMLILALSFTY